MILVTGLYDENLVLVLLVSAYVEHFSCRVLCLVWSHSPCKFPTLRFSRVYCPASFHPNSTKLYEKYGNQEGMQAVTAGDLPNVKGIWHFTSATLSLYTNRFSSEKRSSRVPRPMGHLLKEKKRKIR